MAKIGYLEELKSLQLLHHRRLVASGIAQKLWDNIGWMQGFPPFEQVKFYVQVKLDTSTKRSIPSIVASGPNNFVRQFEANVLDAFVFNLPGLDKTDHNSIEGMMNELEALKGAYGVTS